MSSTNKTTNYELSQYIGSDKPTYLGDYNSDMLKIDTQMKANNDLATTAETKADTAQETATTAVEQANTANTNASNAQATGTQALNKALQNEVNINKFNLTRIIDIAKENITVTGAQCTYSTMKIALNDDGSIFKLYGAFTIENFTSSTIAIEFDTPLRPTEAYDINPIGIASWANNDNPERVENLSVNIGTDGKIRIDRYRKSTSMNNLFNILFPCIFFNKQFGDVA